MGRRAPLKSEQELELVRRYEAGDPTKDLCAAFDRSDTGVRDILRKHGVKPSRSPLQHQLTLEQEKQAAELYESGLNIRQVSAAMGLSEMGAARALRRVDVKMRPMVKRKLLTSEQANQLAQDYQAGGTYESLQAKYGVSNSVIQRVLREHDIQPRIGWASYRVNHYVDRRGVVHDFKSSWELAYAIHLDEEGLDWRYEPVSFELKDHYRYTPDFGIYEDGRLVRFVEVKGWVTDDVRERMAEFFRMYPNEKVTLIGPRELAALGLVEAKYENHAQAMEVFELQQKFVTT